MDLTEHLLDSFNRLRSQDQQTLVDFAKYLVSKQKFRFPFKGTEGLHIKPRPTVAEEENRKTDQETGTA